MTESKSLDFYDDELRAKRYQRRKGFAPERKERMLEIAVDLLSVLTPPKATVLELGAGTGSLTDRLVQTKHFEEIYVTDGAEAMLTLAQETLTPHHTPLHFTQLDFTSSWSELFAVIEFDGVVSSMAIHHADDKQSVFQQVYDVLKPNGAFVFTDHMAGNSANTQYLIARERALVTLGQSGKETPEQIQELIHRDEERQKVEGNNCETVAQYQQYLTECGFVDVDCLWQDFWLAVFIARKPKVLNELRT